jgi:hypothetical protein
MPLNLSWLTSIFFSFVVNYDQRHVHLVQRWELLQRLLETREIPWKRRGGLHAWKGLKFGFETQFYSSFFVIPMIFLEQCCWSDGRIYKGDWVNGKAHGYGKEIRPDGSIRHDGKWDNDKPIS